ncbi:MAG: hypothetical protein QOJ16_945, partial [Acidobacteriota bacterium]|nr:hypothetical protein [Acidobacteriota bacterium]
RSQGATLFMVLLSGFEILLARHSGQELLAVGTPIAARNHLEIENLIGFFVNTLVLRADTRGEPSCREQLARVREETLTAYAHQDLPFERLVEQVAPERSLSRTPLFQAMFVLQNAPLSGVANLAVPGLALAPFELLGKTAKFDLTLAVSESGGKLMLSLEHSTDLFDPSTIARFLGHFERLLGGLAGDPEGRIADLPLLSPAEGHQLLVERGGSGNFPRPEVSLIEVFARQVARAPAAVAVVCGEETLTYGELDRRARRMASGLRALGAGGGSLVGLCVERGLAMVIGILGILKAGSAYVPLEPAQPHERLELLIRNTALTLVVAGQDAAERLPGTGALVVTTDQLERGGGLEGPDDEPAPAAMAAGPAYVIHTSGSTGEHKGVVVSHANVVRLFAVTAGWFGFDAEDVWTLFHSYAFDFSVWEIWGALLHGGRLVVVPYWVSRSPEALLALLAGQGVTVLNQVPSAFAQLSATPESRRELALRWVIFGGEALNPQSLRSWWARHGGDRPALVNMYGITETTVHVTLRRLRQEDVENGHGSLIGVPLPDLAGYVLDRRGRPVPVGVAGELSVSGPGVTAGYLSHPDLTAARFVPNPFPGAAPGDRLYRSGDLACWRATGELEYLGRIDHQVKVRGFRIELGEIETVLKQHPAVAAAAVVARGEGAEDRRLVAYLVPAADATSAIEELRRYLREKLPDYMVPAAFVLLAALPLTGNGKLDRDALPAPGEERPDLEQPYAPPRTPTEMALASIWSRVLGVDRVGVHDNFFALGGDSILSIRVVAQAAQIGLIFALPDLFRDQTVAALAAGLEGAAAPYVETPRPSVAPFALVREGDRRRLPEGLEDAYPLAFIQAGMLYHMVLTPEEPLYQNVDSWHLRGPFVEGPFRAAVERTVARHPMLRTSFDLTGYSEPLQLVHPTATLTMIVEDIRHLSSPEQEAQVDALLARERRRFFDLREAPQLRFHVYRREETSFQFTLTENHAIFDGWSLHSTLVEIFDLYFAFLRGESPEPLPPPRLTYRDHVLNEREAAASPAAAAYWAAVLDRCPATEIPAWPAPPRTAPSAAGDGSSRMRSVFKAMPPEVFQGLKALSRTAAVPWKSVLLAAHLQVMSGVSGQAEVVTGLVASGRSEELGGDEVRGLFLNTLPLRCRLAPGSWVDLVRIAFTAEEALLPYRRYPFAILQRERGRRPLFEVAFNYVHFHVARDLMKMGQLEVLSFKRGPGANFKLMAHFAQDLEGRHATCELEYDSQQLPDSQAVALAGLYERTLAAMAADPGAPVLHFSPLSAAERHQAIQEWNDTGGEPSPEGFNELFARQVAHRPAALAVGGRGGPLSYAELDSAAERLASRLRGLGVGPEVGVGLLLERSASLIVAMVAVLKAGGCYVPLDPTYPEERLAFMLADSRAAVLLTERRLRDVIAAGPSQVLLLDEDEPRPGRGEALAGPWPESLAYQIYTSGSTGRPKAVTITHQNLASLIAWARGVFTPQELAGVLASTSICFDLSVFEILVPLALGGRVIVAENALEVPQLEDGEEITLINTVPSAMAELVRWVPSLASLCTVALAGEALRRDLVSRIHDTGIARVLNLYGPSEDTTYSTCGPQPAGAQTSPAIGRSIAGKRLYLLDASSRLPVPLAVPGEIYLGGQGVARGYLGRPDLTAERFVPDPFARLGGERLYRTGDLGRFRPDGEVEFLGRLDQQVKLRGFRIELGEIEAALAACPGVRDGAVALEEAAGAERSRLLAYVVPEEGVEVSAPALRERLRSLLPEYMLPGEFVLLEALPRTPTGKLDRRALAGSGGQALAPSAAPCSPPGNPTEERLSALWKELLGRDQLGIHDSFFDLGGHSLLLIELQRKLQSLFDREVSIVELFRTPTISALARLLTEGRRVPSAAQEGDDRAQARLRSRLGRPRMGGV